jgi:hypothetical protein
MLWRNIQAATAATLGVAILAAVGTAPASAVNLKTFNISGTFFNGYPNPVYQQDSYGGIVNSYLESGILARGSSFRGTFTADVDKPFDSNIIVNNNFNVFNNVFEAWNVDVFGANGGAIAKFANIPVFDADVGYEFQNGISFSTKFYGTAFELSGVPRYIGNIPVYGVFADSIQRVALETYVSSFQISEPYRAFGENTVFGVQSVPEPFSLGGTALASAMGLWITRRKQKASQST